MTPLAKKLSIVLAVSVAVNLLLGGIMIGRAVRHRPPPPDVHAEPGFRGDRAGRQGPLRGMFREHSDELRDKRRRIGEARHTARTALEAEPFDRAALERALEALRKETTASQEIMHRAIVESAAKGSPDERKRLGRALDQPGMGRKERGPRAPRHD